MRPDRAAPPRAYFYASREDKRLSHNFLISRYLRFFWPVYLNAMPQDPQKSLVNDHQKAVISQGVAKNAEISS